MTESSRNKFEYNQILSRKMLQTELFSKLNDIENVKIIDFASGPVVLNSVALRLTPFNISHQILNDADLSSSKHWNMISVNIFFKKVLRLLILKLLFGITYIVAIQA